MKELETGYESVASGQPVTIITEKPYYDAEIAG